MGIKIAKKITRTSAPKKVEKEQKKSKLPSDEYKDEIPAKELVLSENGKLVISVRRGGELGLPCVDVRHFITTEAYTGFTKKGINLPYELLVDLIDILQEVAEECENKGLE